MNELLAELEKLVGNLDGIQAKAGTGNGAAGPGAAPDAIDAELGRPPRVTAVTSVRESPEMEAFRQAVVDGLIANDAVRQLLTLVNTVLTRVWAVA